MSKFKKGDKVRYIGGDTPNDPMNVGYGASMLRNGEVGVITEIKTCSEGIWFRVQHSKCGDNYEYCYDPNWLELVEDKKPEQPKQKFKVGDKVRCIDDSGQRTINTGCVYQVRDLNVDGLLLLKEYGGSYMHSRFELAEDKPKEAEQPTLFKPDDYVICTDASGSVVTGVIKEGKVYKVKSVSNKGSFIALHGITGSFKAKGFAPLDSTATTIGGNSPDKVWFDEATTLTLGEQDMSIDTTVAVLNKTYIFGKDADTVTVDDVFNHITRLEAEAAMYDSIKNKPKAIKAKVDALKADIESLVKFSDEKFSD